MTDWIVAILIYLGVGFSVLAAVGIVRMPDLYMRMQASAKSATLGVSCLILAAAFRFETVGATTQSLLVVAFLFLTVPISAHMIARSAYASGVELWSDSVLDELHTHTAGPQETSLDSTTQPSPDESSQPDTGDSP